MLDYTRIVKERESKLYRNDFIRRVMPEILLIIQDTLKPEEVFEEGQLVAWAEEHNYVKGVD